MKTNWKKYHIMTSNKPPRPLLVQAVDLVNGHTALDLGAGALNDCKYLLNKGFSVVAIDSTSPGRLPKNKNFRFKKSDFKHAFPVGKFDLISSQYSLPYNGVAGFNKLWANIKLSLKPGGIFAGQLFGNHDAWHKEPNLIFHTKADVNRLLKDVDVLYLSDVTKHGRLTNGKMKHWHYFDIIYRKD